MTIFATHPEKDSSKQSFETTWPYLVFCLSVYALVVLFNDGFIALDEYWAGIVRYLPAQKASLLSLAETGDVKSPFQLLPFFWLAKLALALGIEHPYWQYRFVILGLTILSLFVNIFSFRKLAQVFVNSSRVFIVLLMLFTLHAIYPVVVTRAMFESTALPWVTLAGAMAVCCDHNRKLSELLIGVVAISIAFALRPHAGICALVLIALPLIHRKWRDFLTASALGLFFFVAFGIGEMFWRGSFHHSLRALLSYNWEHGGEYVQNPWYFFLPLLIVIMYLPFWWGHGSGEFRTRHRQLRTVTAMLFLFVFLHSLFQNKFERFLFPAFGLMLILMLPFMENWVAQKSYRKWYGILLVVFNGVLWVPASFFAPQKSFLEIARYFDHNHTELVQIVDKSLDWLPDVLMKNPAPGFNYQDSAALVGTPNSTWLIRKDQHLILAEFFKNCEVTEVFRSNPIDELAYTLNPEKNMRRSSFLLVLCD